MNDIANLERRIARPGEADRKQGGYRPHRHGCLDGQRRTCRPHAGTRNDGKIVGVHDCLVGKPMLLPTADQMLHLSRQSSNDGWTLFHSGCCLSKAGAYPFATNQSIAARSAGYTGKILNPSSRSAFAEEANIIFFPMRTASTVARGSLPLNLPVIVSSKNANVIATACGTFLLGEGKPVMADIRSRICFRVKFSPPRMYLWP